MSFFISLAHKYTHSDTHKCSHIDNVRYNQAGEEKTFGALEADFSSLGKKEVKLRAQEALRKKGHGPPLRWSLPSCLSSEPVGLARGILEEVKRRQVQCWHPREQALLK